MGGVAREEFVGSRVEGDRRGPETWDGGTSGDFREGGTGWEGDEKTEPEGETRSEEDTVTGGKTGKRPEVGGPVYEMTGDGERGVWTEKVDGR